MKVNRRSSRGQSMIEYAIGIGAVTAVCMLMLGGLGHSAADILQAVLVNINDSDDQQADPGSVFAGGGKGAATPPWSPQ